MTLKAKKTRQTHQEERKDKDESWLDRNPHMKVSFVYQEFNFGPQSAQSQSKTQESKSYQSNEAIKIGIKSAKVTVNGAGGNLRLAEEQKQETLIRVHPSRSTSSSTMTTKSSNTV